MRALRTAFFLTALCLVAPARSALAQPAPPPASPALLPSAAADAPPPAAPPPTAAPSSAAPSAMRSTIGKSRPTRSPTLPSCSRRAASSVRSEARLPSSGRSESTGTCTIVRAVKSTSSEIVSHAASACSPRPSGGASSAAKESATGTAPAST